LPAPRRWEQNQLHQDRHHNGDHGDPVLLDEHGELHHDGPLMAGKM